MTFRKKGYKVNNHNVHETSTLVLVLDSVNGDSI